MNKTTNRIHELNRLINEIAHPDDVEVDLVVEDDQLDEGGPGRIRKEKRKNKYDFHSFEMKDTGEDELSQPASKAGSRIKPIKDYTSMNIRRTGHRKSTKSNPEMVKTWRNVQPRKLPK
jgi:hypothetical protein